MFLDDPRAVFIDLEYIAVLDENDVVVRITGDVVLDEFLLPKEHPILAVDRHDEPRPRRLDRLPPSFNDYAGRIREIFKSRGVLAMD